MNKNILIIDDEQAICISLALALEEKYTVKSTVSPAEGIKLLEYENFDLCLLDLKIGKYNGIEVMKELKKIDKNLIVIIMTAYGSIHSSVEAIKNGAFTYLTKPLNIEELFITIEQALEFKRLNEQVKYLNEILEKKYMYSGILGKSPSMNDVFKLIRKLKDVDTTVIIKGDSGTGKELVAKSLHYSGKRKDERFEGLNCAAIPEELLEEELFGHKKGSFTGASSDRQGKFEFADKGTVFLDEIGDMPLRLQSKLLRVIQEKEYSPIGSNEKKKLNVRLIAATNKDLRALVDQGKFREDLYFRINVVEIKLPPLRERKQDIPLLIKHFIDVYNEEYGKAVEGFSKRAERLLLSYEYPGNIRELSNIIENAVILCDEKIIDVDDLPESLRVYNQYLHNREYMSQENLIGKTLEEVEMIMIKQTLLENNGHRQKTADVLGISEKGLRNKIKKFNF